MSPLRFIALLASSAFLSSCASLKPSPYAKLGAQAPSVQSQAFKSQMTQEAKANWVSGNHLTTYVNGQAFFPEMRKAIHSAKHTITFETFAMVSGSETYLVSMALAKKARQGVKVHVILDAIGSAKIGKKCTNILLSAGVQLKFYHPLSVFSPKKSNNRDHRKILVVDGKIGFTGGAGYANAWMGNAHTKDNWRDTMYKITGPAVADLQDAFSDNWKEITGETLAGKSYYPALTRTGNMNVQTNLGAPREQGDTLGASYLLAIDSAKESLLIEHAYFAPNKQLRAALKRAVARGVKVKVITNSDIIDSEVLLEATRIYAPELLDAGIEIYQYQGAMIHSKLIVVDDHLSIIGSGNFDERTYFINDEINLHVLDKSFASAQRKMFNKDLAKCKRMTKHDARLQFKNILRRLGAHILMPQL